MTGTVSVVIIGKDSRFLHYGSEAEARFNVSLTRAKALTVVLAPPSATGPLGMLQTASAFLVGKTWPASRNLRSPLLHCLVCALALRIWMSLLGTVLTSAPWKELLSLKMRDTQGTPPARAPLGWARPEN